jgi:hypothetical protein
MKTNRQHHTLAAFLSGIIPLLTKQEAGWAKQPVWTNRRNEKSLVPDGTRTPNHPAQSLVTIPPTIFQFLNLLVHCKSLKQIQRDL